MKGRRPLSVRDVGALLARSERARDAILVGGQALNIWAVRFGLAAESAVTSDDIDFFGSRAQAIGAGLDWGAKVRPASLDDQTPNTAVVVVEIHDEERGIDFLDGILGVDSAELRGWASDVRGRTYSFRVMHPLHVLQSQLENVYGILRRREDEGGEYYVGRIELAVRVVARAIGELLDAGRIREALKAAERVAEVAERLASIAAWQRDGVDLLLAVPVTDRTWPKRFTETRWPQIRDRIVARRKRAAARAAARPRRKKKRT